MFTHTAFTKKIGIAIFFTIIVLSLLVSSPARAESTTSNDPQMKIEELLKIIKDLQAKLAKYEAPVAKKVKDVEQDEETKKSDNALCIELSTRMYLGVKDVKPDGEVGKLQKFLKESGDYTYGEITGFYGPATERAVQSWQRRNGVVKEGRPDTTGYGAVGPMTIKAMAGGCALKKKEDTKDENISDGPLSKGSVTKDMADGEIEEAEHFYELAKKSINAVKSTHDISVAQEKIEDAKNRLGKAHALFNRKNYTSASEYAQLAKDFAEDAKEIAESAELVKDTEDSELKEVAENELKEAEYFFGLAKDAIEEMGDVAGIDKAEEAFVNAENRLGKAKAFFSRKEYEWAAEYAQLAKDFAEDAKEIAEGI